MDDDVVRILLHIDLTAAPRNNTSFLNWLITQEIVAIAHNKSWTAPGRQRSVADTEGQPNID